MWETIATKNVRTKSRQSVVTDSPEFQEAIRMLPKITIDQSLIMRKMPKLNGMAAERVPHNFRTTLTTYFQHNDLPYTAHVVGLAEVVIKHK